MAACPGSSLPQTWDRLVLYNRLPCCYITPPPHLLIVYLLLLLVLIQVGCLLPGKKVFLWFLKSNLFVDSSYDWRVSVYSSTWQLLQTMINHAYSRGHWLLCGLSEKMHDIDMLHGRSSVSDQVHLSCRCSAR